MAEMKRFNAKFCLFICVAISLVTLSGCQWFKHDAANPMKLPEFMAHVVEIDQAEAVVDPVKRCLSYPTPSEFQWPNALIEAMCMDMHTPVDHLPAIKRMIDAKDWAGLEAHYTDILRRHYSGEDPEYLIHRSFPIRSWKNPEEADDYTLRWLEAAPDDAYANMTRGNLLDHRAWEARGEKSSSETNEKQMKSAMTLAKEAEILLRKASILQPRLIPAYRTLINTQMLAGNSEKIGETFASAIRQSPHSYYVRNTLINFLQPKWGGSLREMDALVDESEPHIARNPRLSLLRARRVGMDGYRFLKREWYGNALDEYRESLQSGPEDNALATGANLAYRERHYIQAIVYSTQEIRFSRDNAYALSRRGSAWEQFGERRRAYCDFRAAVEAGLGEDSVAKSRIPVLEALFVKHNIDIKTVCGPNNPDVRDLRKKLGLK